MTQTAALWLARSQPLRHHLERTRRVVPLALTVRTMDGTVANDRSRGEEAAKGSMPPEHATKETANQKAHPVFLNTTQRPGHVENCPQSEESREERSRGERRRDERGDERGDKRGRGGHRRRRERRPLDPHHVHVPIRVPAATELGFIEEAGFGWASAYFAYLAVVRTASYGFVQLRQGFGAASYGFG